MRLLKSFVIGFAAAVVSSGANGLKCATQTSKDPEDFTVEECSTYCVIAFAKTDLYPSFQQSAAICRAAGCAVLSAGGNFIPEQNLIGQGDYPVFGNVEVYRCDNSTFTTHPFNLEAQAGEPCNLYRDYLSTNQLCQHLDSDMMVAEFFVESSIFERHKVAILVGSVCGSLAIIGLIVFVVKRHHHAEKVMVSADHGKDLEDGNGPSQATSLTQITMITPVMDDEAFPDGDSDEDPFDLDDNNGSYSPSREVSPSTVSSVTMTSMNPSEVGDIPAHLAPGSRLYEKYHEALTSIYRDAGQDVDRVDAVLQQYLARPNGLELLNKKLKHKFGKHLKKLAATGVTKKAAREPRSTQAFNFN